MTGSNKRMDARIACDVPLRLQVDCTWRPVTLVDVSRTGARLRLPLGAVGLGPGLGLAEIAEHLEVRLPSRVSLQFHPERLGTLICRKAKIVHLELEAGLPNEIQVGCVLDEVLTRDEAAALGLPLPLEGESAEAALKSHAVQPPRPRVPARRDTGAFPSLPGSNWFSLADDGRTLAPQKGRARRPGGCLVKVVCAEDQVGDAPEPLVGAVECVDDEGCTVRVPEPMVLRIQGDHLDVRRLTVAFCEAYGPEAELEIENKDADVCRRRASIQRVEMVPDCPGELRVGFTFCDTRDDAA